MTRVRVLLAASVAACTAAAGAWQAQAPAPASDGWRTFEGSWSAAGRRETLPTEGDRPAAILRLAGSIVLTTGDGLGRGFRGEAIGFFDGRSLSVGRAVWTDDRGDRIFSELRGDAVQTGRRMLGTITGGTGRYAGLTGDYSFAWQYVVQAEEGDIQVRTVGLAGRVRPGEGVRP
jgi:hypothetical protein